MPFGAFRQLVAGLFLLLACGGAASAQSRVALLDSTGISIVDTTTGQERARFALTLELEETPNGIASAADGSRLYVTTSKVQDEAALHVLDGFTGRRIALITLPARTFGRAAVTPDGEQAFLLRATLAASGTVTDVVAVDLRTLTAHTLPDTRRAGYCDGMTMHPDGGTFYSGCNAFVVPSGNQGRLDASSIVTGGASFAWGDSPFPSYLHGLSLTADGSRMFALWDWQNLDQRIHVYDTATHAFTSHSLKNRVPNPNSGGVPFSVLGIAAQTASRVFVRLFVYVASVERPHYEDRTIIFDTATDTTVAVAASGGALISDPYAGRTFTLENGSSPRFSLLDNDTAVATTITTGAGWRDAIILKDPCPADAALSPALFTIAGGAGTLTVTAPGSCSWTIDPGTVPGLAFTTLSGSGSVALPFTLASATSPAIETFRVGARTLTVERSMPLMHIDEPGASAAQPFLLRGWAIDVSASPSPAASAVPTISVVHAWAWPVDGGAPRFLGAVPASGHRPDIAATFGSAYGAAEFSVPVHGLPTGTYAIVAYAQSARTGVFSQQAGVLVSVLPGTRIAIDGPGPTVPRTFTVSGWAVDPTATTGPGVDAVHVWAFPESGAAPVWVGAAAYGGPRDDLAALLGPSFRDCGYWLHGSLPPGRYTLQVFARSTVTGEFNASTASLTVVADSTPEMQLDEPVPSATIAGTFQVRGWAIDRGAISGTGIDAFHVWAFPTDGTAAHFVGVAAPTTRGDVADLFGAQFAASGFLLTGATLPQGTYTLAVFAHSTVTASFSVWRIVTITVP